MKRKMLDYVQSRAGLLPRNEQARKEIENFLSALNSYPDRAANDPGLTFQQHFYRLLASSAENRLT